MRHSLILNRQLMAEDKMKVVDRPQIKITLVNFLSSHSLIIKYQITMMMSQLPPRFLVQEERMNLIQISSKLFYQKLRRSINSSLGKLESMSLGFLFDSQYFCECVNVSVCQFTCSCLRVFTSIHLFLSARHIIGT